MKAAIFDVDGTLLDSMSVWEDIGERYLTSQNITAEKNLRAALHTMSLEQGAVWMKEKYQLDKSISQIIEEVLKIVSDFYRFEAPLKPGVKKTLEWFKERNIQMTVATSGNRELTEAALARNGILDYFEQIEDALHAAETAKKAGFVVVGVYDEENRKNISKMKEVCDCYCDRMDAAIENIR